MRQKYLLGHLFKCISCLQLCGPLCVGWMKENLESFLVLIFLSFFSSFFSQFEEKFEELNGTQAPSSFPLVSSSGSNENQSTEMVIADSSEKELELQDGHRMSSDLTASQEFVGGMMKIVPDVDVSFG